MRKFDRRKSSDGTRRSSYVAEALERRTLLSTLFINGTSANDLLFLTIEGSSFRVSPNGGIGTLYSTAGVTRVEVAMGNGNDQFSFTGNLGIPFNINCGTGDDYVSFSGPTGSGDANLDAFTGASTTIAGGTGSDKIVCFDNANTTADAYSISSTRVDRTVWSGCDYANDVESVIVQMRQVGTVSIASTSAATSIDIQGSLVSAGTFNIGTASRGMQDILGAVRISSGPTAVVNLNNAGDATARTWTIDQIPDAASAANPGFTRVVGLSAGTVLIREQAAQVTLTDGLGTDVGTVAAVKPDLYIENAGTNGRDVLKFGSLAFGGMRGITGFVGVNNGVGRTNLIFDATGDATARTVTLDTTITSYNVLTGLAAGTIAFWRAETGATTLTTGSGADAVNVRNFEGASALTIGSDDGQDMVRLGGTGDLNYPTETAQGITAPVDVLRGVSGDLFSGSLIVDNGGDAVARTVAVDFDAVTGFQSVSGLMPYLLRYGLPLGTFDAAAGVVLIDGSGAGSYGVRAVRAPLTIENVSQSGPIERPGPSGDGRNASGDATNDTVTLGSLTVGGSGSLVDVTADLTVRNRYDVTTLSVNDVLNTAARTVIISSFSFGSKPGASIGVNGFVGGGVKFVADEVVSPVVYRGGSGDDVFRVLSTPATTASRIDLGGNGGNDTFYIGSGVFPSDPVSLDPINGPVSVIGSTGIDALVIDNSGGPGGGLQQIVVETGQVTSAISAAIGFASGGIDAIDVRPSAAGNQVVVRDTLVGQLVTVRSGAGNDGLNVQSTALGSPVTLIGASDGSTGTDNLIVDLFQTSTDAAEVVLSGGFRGGMVAYGPVSLIRFAGPLTAVANGSFGTVGGGLIDIGQGAIAFDYSGAAGPSGDYVRSQIALGRHGGDWQGVEGITSSAAIANPSNVTVGSAEATTLFSTFPATFRGVGGIDNSTVLVYATVAGDANGDGVVGFDDLLKLAQNYGQSNRSFGQGDFSYSADGKVDFDDLLILAQHYGTSFLTSSLSAAPPTADAKRPKRTATDGLLA